MAWILAWSLFLAGLAMLLVTILADRWVARHRDEQPESRPGRVDDHTVKPSQPVSPEMPSTRTDSEVDEIPRTAKQQGCDSIRGIGRPHSTTESSPYYEITQHPKSTSQDTRQPEQKRDSSFEQAAHEPAREVPPQSNASEASSPAGGHAPEVDWDPRNIPRVLEPAPELERHESDAMAREAEPSAPGPLEGIRAVVEQWNRAGRSRNLDLWDFAEKLGASRWRVRRVLDGQRPTAFYLVDDGLAQSSRRLYVLVGIGEWYTEQVALVFQGDQGPCGPGREVLVDKVLEPATFFDESEVSFDRMDLKYLLIPNYIRRGRVRVREPGRS